MHLGLGAAVVGAVVMMVVSADATNLVKYSKVASSFPDTIADCLLTSFASDSSSNIRCAAACNLTPYCTLYCIKGIWCSLFRARVTSLWAGMTGTTNVYDKCFSTYPLSGDVAQYAVTASKSIYLNRNSQNAVNATFYCSNNQPACYESDVDDGPWWRADLGQPMSIGSVIIHYSYLINPDVEFRLGNNSIVNNNPLFVTTYTTTPYNGIVLIPNQPKVGRYFFVSEPANSDIAVCDVWILPG